MNGHYDIVDPRLAELVEVLNLLPKMVVNLSLDVMTSTRIDPDRWVELRGVLRDALDLLPTPPLVLTEHDDDIGDSGAR
ncbi:hypothetical protein [Actinokineospora sp.]|uniref:hypothetical protein n=1 Tax=Actinokineospora sp. TaxID=1872133 RepID=UPI00403776BA